MQDEAESLPQNEPAIDNSAASRQIETPQPKPWGFWTTIGFCCIIGAAYIAANIIIAFAFIIQAVISNPHLDTSALSKKLESSGLFISLSTILGAVAIISLVVLFAGIRKQIKIKEYLCLKNPGLKQVAIWSLALVLFAFCSDVLTYFLSRPIVPEFMTDAYSNAGFVPLLWFALIVAAPFSEEFLFRGFLFKGIEYSKLGSIGAILITAFLWSIIHLQYDLYGIASIFAGGLLVGIARLKTGSVYVPVVMHSLMNLIATVECAVVLAGK